MLKIFATVLSPFSVGMKYCLRAAKVVKAKVAEMMMKVAEAPGIFSAGSRRCCSGVDTRDANDPDAAADQTAEGQDVLVSPHHLSVQAQSCDEDVDEDGEEDEDCGHVHPVQLGVFPHITEVKFHCRDKLA